MKAKLFFVSFLFISLSFLSNKSYSQTLNFTLNQQIYGYVLVQETGLTYPDTWTIEYWPSGTTGQSLLSSGITTSGIYIQVSPSVSYDFRVRKVTNGVPQVWSDIQTLDNSCTAISHYVGYTFDFNSNPVNECWRGVMTNGVLTSPYSQLLHSGTDISITSSTNLAHSSYLISPKFEDLGTDKKIKFLLKYTQTSNPARPIAVGTMTNPSDITTFHLLAEVSATATATEKTLYLNNYNGIDKYIAFKTSNSRGTFYIDDFKYEQSISCVGITNVAVNNITEHTAQLSFTGPYQTNWELSLYNPTTGTQVLNINQNPYTFQNLLGNTGYQVKIRAICDIGNYTAWTPITTFQTTCDGISAGYETSFENTPVLDKCWSTITNGNTIYSSVTSNGFPPRTGTYAVVMRNDNNPSQNTFLITPYINDLDNNKRVSFYFISRGWGDYNNNSLTIGTMSNPTDATTFVAIKTISALEMNEVGGYNVRSDWKQHFVYLTEYDTTLNHHYIAFKQNTLQADSTFEFDDFIYEVTPNCTEPSSPIATHVSFDNVTLAWNIENSNTATEWQIEYGPIGFVNGTGTIVDANSNPFTITTGLLDNTDYMFYVRSKCGNNYSNWSDKGYFKTTCIGVNAGYTTSFENERFSDNTTCWRRLIAPIRNDYYTPNLFLNIYNPSTNVPAHTGTGTMFHNVFTTNFDIPEKTVLVSPRFIDFDNSKKISFWVYIPSNYSSTNTIVVGTLSNPDDYSTFSPFYVISAPFTINQWRKYTVDFSNYIGTDKYIGIKQTSPNNGGYFYMDDFEYLENECRRPSALTAFQSGQTSETLSWNTNITDGSVTSWEIEYGPIGFVDGTGTLVTANSNPLVLTGLQNFTSYEYRVRNICGNGFLNWSNRYSFNITCQKTAPFYDNFDQYTLNVNTYNYDDSCWTTSLSNYNSNISEFSLNNVNSSPNALYFNNVDKNGYIISPYLQDLDNSKRIKFWLHNYYGNFLISPNNIEVIIGSIKNPLDLTTFSPIGTIQVANLPEYGKEFNFDLSGYTGSNKHIAFKINVVNPISSYIVNYLYIDNFYYDVIPNCYEPTDIKFLNINNNSTLIKWNNESTIQNISIEYGLTGFTQGTGTTVTSNQSEKLITGLTSSTNYDFYFKTICSNGQSIVVGPKKLSTTCEMTPLPWLETFNNLSEYGENVLPSCFKYVYGDFELRNSPLISSTNYYSPDSIPSGYDDTSFLLWGITTSSYNTEIMSPMFNLMAGTTYKLMFQARKGYQWTTQGVGVAVCRGQEAHFKEANIHGNYEFSEYEYTPAYYFYTPIVSGSYSFLFHIQNSGNIHLILDNLELKEGYNSVINDYTNYNFDQTTFNDPNVILENTISTNIIVENQSLKMSGSQNNEFNAFGDIWEKNQENITKVNMKVNTTSMTTLFMKFDLNQTFVGSHENSKFRVLVNGIVIDEISSNIFNRSINTSLPFEYDLSQYVGSDIRISLQHVGKSIDDIAYLDNLSFSPTQSLSTNEYDLPQLRAYPNPTTNYLSIENTESISKVEITNISGQILNTVYTDDLKFNLDVSNYSNGIYFVKVYVNEKNKTLKIVKK